MNGGAINSPAFAVLYGCYGITHIAVSSVMWYSLNVLIYQDFQGPTM